MEQGYFTLVLIAMINVLVSLYYYLLVLKAAYLLKPDTVQPDLQLSPSLKLLTGLLILVMVGLGIYPTFLLEVAAAAVRVLV